VKEIALRHYDAQSYHPKEPFIESEVAYATEFEGQSGQNLLLNTTYNPRGGVFVSVIDNQRRGEENN
jgi:hypothetical protein